MKSKLEQINKLISEMEDEVPEGEVLDLDLDWYQTRKLECITPVNNYTLKAKLVREVEL